MFKQVLVYGAALAALALALTLLQYKLVIVNHSLEVYAGTLALIFTILGIIAGKKLTKPKQVIVEKTVEVPRPHEIFVPNEQLLGRFNISRREYEILLLMSKGFSNQEIADRAFISLNTVKTHTSNLFVKLDVKRRTQAVLKAKQLQLIP